MLWVADVVREEARMRKVNWRLAGILLVMAVAVGMAGFAASAACRCVGDDCYEDVVVSGAGDEWANGTYKLAYVSGGRPAFSMGNGFWVFYDSG